jgi:hypothetical protein
LPGFATVLGLGCSADINTLRAQVIDPETSAGASASGIYRACACR